MPMRRVPDHGTSREKGARCSPSPTCFGCFGTSARSGASPRKPVPDELVHQVLTAAIHGPSGSNTQPWHFIVVRDPTVKQAISAVYEEARAAGPMSSAGGARQPLAAAPVLIVACVTTPASGQAGFQTGASIYPSVQNLLLAARALGLGSCLTTLHRRRKARIHAILSIPDHIETAAIIPLGWPDRDYGPNRRPRWPSL